ncbi:hypothetical protein OBBRIDRAFT_824088 [Obba rivulosa]|uniref:Uncharacterized protein n=1 Tax=Obba rivulosa TaxID=1052685 RepID=A0A8E2DPI9_9APHY|nr:hypothetical protein OBBRIDRAFT_824088 [Obba rivulosa]
MSLRIKISKTALETAGSQAVGPSKPSKSKRRIDSDDEEEEVPESRSKRARRTRSPAYDALDPVDEIEEDVNIDDDDGAADSRFLPEAVESASASPVPETRPSGRRRGSSQASNKSAKSRAEIASNRPKRKKRTVLFSEDEDNEFIDAGASGILDPDDDDFAPEPSVSRKNSVSGRGRGTKTAVARGGRGKPKKEEKEISMKDERKLSVASGSREGSAGSGTVFKRSRTQDDESITDSQTTDIVVDADDTSAFEPPAKAKESTPPPPKKRKLPPIKKNKLPTAGSSASTPGSVTAKLAAAAAGKGESTPINLPPATNARKQLDANVEIDLRDSSVYQELFLKKAGGNTPNSGLNRKEKAEERRKELNKLREDARAKRVEEARRSFDLQAANEKISRFEEKLRRRNSMARFPNILGAVFKEAQERSRMTDQQERKER